MADETKKDLVSLTVRLPVDVAKGIMATKPANTSKQGLVEVIMRAWLKTPKKKRQELLLKNKK